MNFVPFSKKQLAVLTWWYPGSPMESRDALICDGAVRSGKTLCMAISFVFWAFFRFRGQSFAFCGKTIASLRRNVVSPLLSVLPLMGMQGQCRISQNRLEIRSGRVQNTFYLFGGRDESSAALIQGMTLAGVLLDEAALMPRSFVEQALARCSVAGSRFWFNCNPEHPGHWFFRGWILKAEEKNACYLHFRMEDNPSLSSKVLKRYQSLYSGVFYQRFVEGKWVAAQGLVYPNAAADARQTEAPGGPYEEWCISCDYGTVNPASFGLWGRMEGVWYRVREYYYDSRAQGEQKTDEEYYLALEELAGNHPIQAVIVDPSAASFLETIRRHGKYRAIPAKNNVADGIRQVADALKSGRIRICRTCPDTIREFELYRWDDSRERDVPRKEHDHAMDDVRYFTATYLDSGAEDCCALAFPRRRC